MRYDNETVVSAITINIYISVTVQYKIQIISLGAFIYALLGYTANIYIHIQKMKLPGCLLTCTITNRFISV